MNWTDWVWLGLGFGLGLGGRQLLQQSAQLPDLTKQLEDNQPPKQDHLRQVELAYQMATEMSQFKGGFLARTSHELRSPLNGLIGMHQLVLSDLCDDPAEEREFIAQAHTSALKMIKLLDDILDVAKVEHGTAKLEIQPIELATLLQEVQTLVYLQAKDRNLQLRVLLPEPDLYVLADPRRLKQVLVNLIDTVIGHLPEGAITVSVSPATSSNYINIWIDDPRSPEQWSEPINLLESDLESSILPSPGLKLLTNQLLLQSMQGQLQLIETNSESALASDPERRTPSRQIQCSIPLIVPEAE